MEKEDLLPRSLATRYRGWMLRGLREAINLAGEQKRDLLLNKEEEHTKRLLTGKKESAFRADLEKASGETGATIIEGKRFIIVRPKAA